MARGAPISPQTGATLFAGLGACVSCLSGLAIVLLPVLMVEKLEERYEATACSVISNETFFKPDINNETRIPYCNESMETPLSGDLQFHMEAKGMCTGRDNITCFLVLDSGGTPLRVSLSPQWVEFATLFAVALVQIGCLCVGACSCKTLCQRLRDPSLTPDIILPGVVIQRSLLGEHARAREGQDHYHYQE